MDRGVKSCDRLCTFLDNSPEPLAVWFNIAKAGAVMIPLNTDLHDKKLAYVLRGLITTMIFLDESTRENYLTTRDDDNGLKTEFLIGGSPPWSSYESFKLLC